MRVSSPGSLSLPEPENSPRGPPRAGVTHVTADRRGRRSREKEGNRAGTRRPSGRGPTFRLGVSAGRYFFFLLLIIFFLLVLFSIFFFFSFRSLAEPRGRESSDCISLNSGYSLRGDGGGCAARCTLTLTVRGQASPPTVPFERHGHSAVAIVGRPASTRGRYLMDRVTIPSSQPATILASLVVRRRPTNAPQRFATCERARAGGTKNTRAERETAKHSHLTAETPTCSLCVPNTILSLSYLHTARGSRSHLFSSLAGRLSLSLVYRPLMVN